MPAFAVDETMRDSRDPICRVVVLEDDDGDGAMDRRSVFADGLVLPRAIKTLADGVLVGEPPYLWWMRDTDGDLKLDEKRLVAEGYGRRDANPEHNANSLVWGLDNRLHTSEHDWQLRFRAGRFELEPTLVRGQWGGSIDDAGRLYRNVNNGPLFVDLVPARYFLRNPNRVRTRGLYEPLIGLEEAVAWPIRPTRGVNRGYRERFFRPDGTSRILQSAATPVVYRGDRLPAELRGGVFVTDSTTHLVHWFRITDDGTGRPRAEDGFARGEIFASSDERLRPVGAASAPDGTLWVVDMYRGVVQDLAYQTDYLKHHIERNGLARSAPSGRIWRLVHETTRREDPPALSRETPAGLVARLSHPNGWWRDTAQQLLVQRGDASVAPALERLAADAAAGWRSRLHALGALDGLGALRPELLQPLVSDASSHVRVWAIRWSEPWLAEPGHPLAAAVLERIDDASWSVRRQLAASIGELPARARPEPALELLRRYGDDPVTVDALVSGLAGLEGLVLERLLQDPAADDRDDAVVMLAGAHARAGHPERLRRLAQGSGARAALAAELAGRIDWPGKPRASRRAVPLTPEQRARFDAGRELYQNLCLACHGADGRGGEGVARSLVGSEMLDAPPGRAIRIVLAGMEGEIGLMPPLMALGDAEIAAVLTYVRREWGNAGAPVETGDVTEIRGLSALRDRPWSLEELTTAEGRR
jgi:mono/diheme cytochrome c family protein